MMPLCQILKMELWSDRKIPCKHYGQGVLFLGILGFTPAGVMHLGLQPLPVSMAVMHMERQGS